MGQWCIYTICSLTDNSAVYEGHCARLGWAFVAINDGGAVVAAASGSTPGWIATIFGAELWALFMALSVAVPGSGMHANSSSMRNSTACGDAWASLPWQLHACLWSEVIAALGDGGPVVWMLAHTTAHHVGVSARRRRVLTASGRYANALAEHFAKKVAGLGWVPEDVLFRASAGHD